MRMGNLSLRRWVTKSQRGELEVDVESATYKGVYGKAALFAVLTIVSAIVAEMAVLYAFANDIASAFIGIVVASVVCSVLLLIISLVIAFAPSTAKVLGIVYSILQGGLLGCLSLVVDIFVAPGISIAALLGTAIVFVVSIAVNRLFNVRISSRFVRGLMVAIFSIAIVQLVMWVLSLVGVFDYTNTIYLWIQVIASTLCIIWATIMLSWDIQNVDYLVRSGADRKYEWNVAFALVTTLIYLYIEILELIMRIVMLFSKNKK